MKSLLAAAVLSLVVPGHALTPAQTKSNATPASFAAFWSRFKAAVARDDRAAVASMTKLPFPLDNKELDRERFVKNYDRLFDRRIKRCFATARPVRDGQTYSIFCGAQGILFERDGDAYKLTSFYAND